MSTFENFWNQLDAPVEAPPLSRKEAQYRLLDSNKDKLNLSPDEEYKMGWGADALPEDWIANKAKDIQKNIDESSSVAVLRKGAEKRAQDEAAADGPMAKAASALSGVAARQGGNGGPQTDHNPSWTALGDVGQANYYANNPAMAAITQLGQAGFGLTNLGKLQAKYAPDFVRQQEAIARGDAFGGGPSFGNVNLGNALAGLGQGDTSKLGVSLGSFGDSDDHHGVTGFVSDRGPFGLGPNSAGGVPNAGGYNTGVGSYGGSLWGGGVGGSHSIGG